MGLTSAASVDKGLRTAVPAPGSVISDPVLRGGVGIGGTSLLPMVSSEVGTGEAALIGGYMAFTAPFLLGRSGLGASEELWGQIMTSFCHTRLVVSLAVHFP